MREAWQWSCMLLLIITSQSFYTLKEEKLARIGILKEFQDFSWSEYLESASFLRLNLVRTKKQK